MKKLYNLFTKYNLVIFMVVLLFTFNLFFCITIQTIKFDKERNSISGSSAVKFCLSNHSKLNSKILIKEIEDEDVLTIEVNNKIFHTKDDIVRGKAVYSKMEQFEGIPLLKGRFLSIDEYKSDRPYIVIGKNMEEYIKIYNGKEYILLDDMYFEVIGIMGKNKVTTAFDNTFYINLSAIKLPNINQDITFDYKIISNGKKEKLRTLLNEISYKYDNSTLNFISAEEKVTLNDILDKAFKFLFIIFLVFLFIILNIFNVMKFWIEQNKLKYTLNRMVGASKLHIIKLITADILKLLIISVFTTYIVNFPGLYFIGVLFPEYTFNNSILSLIYASIALTILCMITLILPIFRIINREINRNIRGI